MDVDHCLVSPDFPFAGSIQGCHFDSLVRSCSESARLVWIRPIRLSFQVSPNLSSALPWPPQYKGPTAMTISKSLTHWRFHSNMSSSWQGRLWQWSLRGIFPLRWPKMHWRLSYLCSQCWSSRNLPFCCLVWRSVWRLSHSFSLAIW